ncbi:lysine transporter [Piscirickettsia salmonis]|uniref:Lysine-specific permease n=1 Tax=Piscirickettsia salmonis TaxID=1238 RepID=A0A9Q5V7Z3_PISSA|nr:amino acid permease [Piscirickettsia salmonis]ALA24019.1 amino acid permease family protein [Piscirickettsia salmonis]APS44427.1 lysine transporter [Piscirickettsia salmonis]APS47788.1 lysine transporter [Piscirickettsia salmonis]APS51745.1 lysine transporter [Piscirickettsia salmonis]APS54964.1 lysine transporter [Piscirickettsia salmonis]
METNQTLQRNLKPRHLIMLALGGTIGTGLLLASGGAVHSGGPGGAILGYLLVAVIVLFVMTSLGELTAFSPTTGSFCDDAARYVDPSFGFAMSWNYWLNWVFVVASEVIAAGLVMQFWFPHVDVWIWSALFFLLILAINLVAVKLYGEVEYWIAFIKVAAVIIFITVGTLMIFGLVGSQGSVGFDNITLGDAPFHHGLFGFFSVFLIAGYSFQGVELMGVAAGEADEPKKTIPKAVKTVFWRIVLFYILAIAVISFLIPYTDSNLVNAHSSVASSPFTIVFENAGIKFAASLMNLVVITAILSAANASMYTASRMLWHMGKAKEASGSFQRVNKYGVPVIGVIVTALISVVLILASTYHGGLIFSWLVNMVSYAGYIAWFGICLSHYRFRRAYLLQGKDVNQLPYRSRWFPFAPITAMVLIIAILIGQEVMDIINNEASFSGFIINYCGIVLFLVLVIIHKFIKKNKLIPLNNIELTEESVVERGADTSGYSELKLN